MIEFWTAILKGLGRRPTRYLLRYSPTWIRPFRFDLLEVSRCETDGMVVTANLPQSSRRLHAGHRIKSPKLYSLWEVLMVQLRLIR